MIQIGDVVVSLDVFQEKFLCDLGACKGACCIEGDAGAPVELDEVMELEEVLPVIWDELASEARAVIEKQGDCCRRTEKATVHLNSLPVLAYAIYLI